MLILSLLASCRSVSLIATCNSMNTPLLWTPSQLVRFRWQYILAPTFDSFVMEIYSQMKKYDGRFLRNKIGKTEGDTLSTEIAGDDTKINHDEEEDTHNNNNNNNNNNNKKNTSKNVTTILKCLSVRHKELVQLFIKTCKNVTDSTNSSGGKGVTRKSTLKPITDKSGNLPAVYINDAYEGDMNIEHFYEVASKQLVVKSMNELVFFLKELVDQNIFYSYETDKKQHRVKSTLSVQSLLFQLKNV